MRTLNPRVIAQTVAMFEMPYGPFKLEDIFPGDHHIFGVTFEGKLITINTWEASEEGNIRLVTTLSGYAAELPAGILAMLPDLEQCAALGLARHGRPAVAHA